MATPISGKTSPKSTTETKRRKTPTKQNEAIALVPPSHEAISKLAEKYWRERGHQSGSAEQDWLRAEQELRGKVS